MSQTSQKVSLINKSLVFIIVKEMEEGLSVGERKQSPRISQHIFSSHRCRKK